MPNIESEVLTLDRIYEIGQEELEQYLTIVVSSHASLPRQEIHEQREKDGGDSFTEDEIRQVIKIVLDQLAARPTPTVPPKGKNGLEMRLIQRGNIALNFGYLTDASTYNTHLNIRGYLQTCS